MYNGHTGSVKPGTSTLEHSGALGGRLRILSTAVVIAGEVLLFRLIVSWLESYAVALYSLLIGIGCLTALLVQTLDDNPSYKMAWTYLLLLLPGLGLCLYWLWGSTRLSDRHPIMYLTREFDVSDCLSDDAASEDLRELHPDYYTMSRYLKHTANAALYENTRAKYFPSGEAKFEALLEDLQGAREFIFLEYFIIANGVIWDSIHEILRERAAAGVDVRLIYDDFGSLLKLHRGFREELAAEGIQVVRFNPVNHRPTRMILNYRNHQKIVVIDGNIGYTGGINIGDEYANLEVRFGHWKDTAIRLEGEAVWGLTLTFLHMWHVSTLGGVDRHDIDRYRPHTDVQASGFFQPFADGPSNNPQNPASGIYKRMIYSARERITITSPYLILDSEMIDALVSAAESGVTVRVITPRIGDKGYVHLTSRSFYGRLLRGGVKVYEYTPGFMHAKMVLADDRSAIVGTINMDFRSFYLHFENAVWICDAPVVADIARDIEHTLAQCREIEYEQWRRRPFYVKAVQVALNLFSPLM